MVRKIDPEAGGGAVRQDVRKEGNSMKAIKRKLLSLVLAMAMVLSLAPTALAADLTATINVASQLTLTAQNTVSTNATVSLPADAVTAGYVMDSCTWTVDGTTVSGDTSGATLTFTSAKNYAIAVSGTATKPASEDGSVQEDTVNFTGSASITVNAYVAPADPTATSVTISGAEKVTVGSTISLSATVQGEQNVAQTVKWTSSDPTTATVGETTGIVTGVKAGSVTITATADAKGANNAVVKNTKTITVENAVTVSTVTVGITGGVASVAAGSNLGLTVTGITPPLASGAYDTITWTSNNTSVLTVSGNGTSATATGVAAGEATVTVQYKKGTTVVAQGTSAKITVTANDKFQIVFTPRYTYDNYFNTSNNTFSSINAYVDVSYKNIPADLGSSYSIVWSISPNNNNVVELSNSTYSTATLRSVGGGSVTLSVTLRSTTNPAIYHTASAPVYVNYQYQLNPTVTVYRNSNYNLSDNDVNNGRSIIQQVSSGISGLYSYPYIVFTDNNVTGGSLTARLNQPYFLSNSIPSGSNGGLLSDIDFIPSNSSATKAEFRFMLYYYNGVNASSTSVYTGLMTFNLTGDSSVGDITYTAELGKDVYFELRDFENFYYDRNNRGSLSYVTFTLPSGGTLYADGGRLSSGNQCYASPTRTQTDLAGVYFSPPAPPPPGPAPCASASPLTAPAIPPAAAAPW